MNDKQRFIHDNRKLRAMMDVTFTEIYAYIKRGDTTASEQSTFDDRENEVKENKKKLSRSGALKPFFDALHEADRQLMSAEGHLRRSREDRFKNDLAVAITKLRECRRVIMAEKPKHSGRIRIMFDKLEVIMGNLETQARETHTAASRAVVKDREMQHVSSIREVVTALRTQVEDYVSTGTEQTWDVGELDRRDKSGKHALIAQLEDFDTKLANAQGAVRGRPNWSVVDSFMNTYVSDVDEMLQQARSITKAALKHHVEAVLRPLKDSADILSDQVKTKDQNMVRDNLAGFHKEVRKLVKDVKRDTRRAQPYNPRGSMFNKDYIMNNLRAYLNVVSHYTPMSADSGPEKNRVKKVMRDIEKYHKLLIKELKRESTNHSGDAHKYLSNCAKLLGASLSGNDYAKHHVVKKLLDIRKPEYYTKQAEIQTHLVDLRDAVSDLITKFSAISQTTGLDDWDQIKNVRGRYGKW